MATHLKRSNKKGGVSYFIRVSLGYDERGKQRTVSETWKPPKDISEEQLLIELAAEKLRFEKEVKAKYKEKSEHKDLTFKAIAEEWFDFVQNENLLKISSVEGMKSYRERVYEAFGDKLITEIRKNDVKDFIRSLAKQGANQRTGGRLSPKTQNNYKSFISNVFNYAIDELEIDVENCSHKVKATKFSEQEQLEHDANEKERYTMEELVQLLNAIMLKAPTKYKLYFLLLTVTGTRRAEILGLQYDDFCKDNHLIRILRTSNYRNKETGIYPSTTKNYTSKRDLYAPDLVFELLEQLKNEQSNIPNSQNMLFIQRDGKPMHPNTPYTWLERFCKREGLRFEGVHIFRGSYISLLETSFNTPIVTTQSIVGHSSYDTTQKYYARAYKEQSFQVMQMFDEELLSELSYKTE